MSQHTISYSVPGYAPSQVAAGKSLSIELDASSSPLLFGCRTGICGTCLVEVQEGLENLPPADADERELLDVLTDNPRARLACQIQVNTALKLRPLGQ
jgi:ferredoxin